MENSSFLSDPFFWVDLFSALGTVGALIMAIFLAKDNKRMKLDCVFVFEAPTNYIPLLVVYNVGNKAAVIEKITIMYHNEVISEIDMIKKYKINEIIVPIGQVVNIKINTDDFKDTKKPTNEKEQHDLSLIIKTKTGEKFTASQKCSYDEFNGLLFGNGLFGDDDFGENIKIV